MTDQKEHLGQSVRYHFATFNFLWYSRRLECHFDFLAKYNGVYLIGMFR